MKKTITICFIIFSIFSFSQEKENCFKKDTLFTGVVDYLGRHEFVFILKKKNDSIYSFILNLPKTKRRKEKNDEYILPKELDTLTRVNFKDKKINDLLKIDFLNFNSHSGGEVSLDIKSKKETKLKILVKAEDSSYKIYLIEKEKTIFFNRVDLDVVGFLAWGLRVRKTKLLDSKIVYEN